MLATINDKQKSRKMIKRDQLKRQRLEIKRTMSLLMTSSCLTGTVVVVFAIDLDHHGWQDDCCDHHVLEEDYELRATVGQQQDWEVLQADCLQGEDEARIWPREQQRRSKRGAAYDGD
jgi:hypothetical protein